MIHIAVLIYQIKKASNKSLKPGKHKRIPTKFILSIKSYASQKDVILTTGLADSLKCCLKTPLLAMRQKTFHKKTHTYKCCLRN